MRFSAHECAAAATAAAEAGLAPGNWLCARVFARGPRAPLRANNAGAPNQRCIAANRRGIGKIGMDA